MYVEVNDYNMNKKQRSYSTCFYILNVFDVFWSTRIEALYRVKEIITNAELRVEDNQVVAGFKVLSLLLLSPDYSGKT
jgi:hypothetical protein